MFSKLQNDYSDFKLLLSYQVNIKVVKKVKLL